MSNKTRFLRIVFFFLVRLTAVEIGIQFISPSDSIYNYVSNQTDYNLLYRSLRSNNGSIQLHENQLIRLTCAVLRALPAVSLHFPFGIDHRIERNLTIENNDKTYRTILVLILRIHRHFHKRLFHCEASQIETINNEKKQKSRRVRSNIIQMDVACKYIDNIM